MEHKIIELLNNKMTSNLKLEEIAKKLCASKEEIKEVIDFLEESGTIFLDKSDKYCLTSKTSLKKGTIKVTKRKGPIVVLEDGTDLDLIHNSHSNVKHNDIVLVEPYKKGGTAQLVKVISRKYLDSVGEVIQEGKKCKLLLKNGDSITLNKRYPEGTKILIDGKTKEIKSILGHKDDPDMRIKELLIENDFTVGFSDEYERELEYIPYVLSEEVIEEAKNNGVVDIRNIPLVTIDGSDTKDFDDAVCFWNNMLFVGIANTSSTIKEGSVIDKDTIKRGISVYPPGSVNPMIHHKISNGICSLNPNEDRFSVSSVTKFGDNYEIKFTKTGPSIINSKKRMTYEEVNKFLEEGIILPGYEMYSDMLTNLYNFAMKQKKKMLNEGFLEFSSTEVKMIFENERITGVKKRHHGKAEELIEFIMLYHNLLMTNEFIKRGLPFIARNHDEPRHEKITALNKLLSQRGYKVDIKEHYNNEDIKKIIASYIDKEERVVLDSIAIRAQSKAKYSAFNKGHFALGLKAYATFTSPIRRLSDYINQRIYMDALKYGDKFARDKWEPRMEMLAKNATDSELRAIKVERQADDIMKAKYMTNIPIGSKYCALVSSIENNYIKILLPNMIYGKVYYNPKKWTISKDGFSIISNSNGEKILVGDSIDVVLEKINIETGEVFFTRQGYKKDSVYEEKKGKKKIRTK